MLVVCMFACDNKSKDEVIIVDPMITKGGVASKLIMDEKTLHVIDSGMKFGMSKIKLKLNDQVILLNNNKSDTLRVKWSKNSGNIKSIYIEVDSSNEYIEVPITNKNEGSANVSMKVDSTLLPGIFKILVRGKDSLGNYTNAIEKYVVVDNGSIDFTKLQGKWNFKKLTGHGSHVSNLASVNRFHYVEFNKDDAYEWYQLDSIIKYNKRISLISFMFMFGPCNREQAIKDASKYITNNNSIRFIKNNTKQAGYEILTLIRDRMIIKEKVGEGNRFAILMKIN